MDLKKRAGEREREKENRPRHNESHSAMVLKILIYKKSREFIKKYKNSLNCALKYKNH